jgi:hypothetical protein
VFISVHSWFSQVHAGTVISATITITNAPALTNATSGQKYTLNGDVRTFTNSVASAATQIRVRTNDSAATILLSLVGQAGAYPFTGIPSMTTSGGTNVTFRATNDTALVITLSPTNWGKVTYSTQTVGTVQTVVRVPISAEDSGVRASIVEQLLTGLNDYSTSRAFTNWTLRSPTFAGAFTFAGPEKIATRTVTASGTVTTNDYFLAVIPTNAVALTLPSAASSSNQLWLVHDQAGSAGSYNISIEPAAGDRINGATNFLIGANYGAAAIISRGGTNLFVYSSGGSAVTGGANLGSSNATVKPIFSDIAGGALRLFSLEAGTGAGLSMTSTSIVVSASGEINTASNLGSSNATVKPVFSDKTGADLRFRQLEAGTGTTLGITTTSVVVNATGEINTASNLGSSNATVKPWFSDKSGADLRFRQIEAGTGVTLGISSTSIVVNASGALWGGNGVFVDAVNGNDGTGARGSITTSFQTITAAKTAAAAGDTIFVLPGTYPENDLLKDGVNYHFFIGAMVTNSSSSVGIFDDTTTVAAAVTCQVTGDGNFQQGGNFSAVYLQYDSSIDLEFKTIKSYSTSVQALQTYNATGYTKLRNGTIEGAFDAVIRVDGTGKITLDHVRVENVSNTAGYSCLSRVSGTPKIILRDCILVTGASTTYSIDVASGGITGRIYNGLTATKTNHASVTWVVGATRFEVDADVQ